MNSIKFILLSIVLVSINVISVSQSRNFVGARVIMKDGTVKNGFIKPMKTGLEKEIDFEENENTKREKISTEQIEEFYLKFDDGESKYVKQRSYNYKKTKVNPTAFWVQELLSGEAASLYVSYTPDSRIYTGDGMAHGMPADMTFYGMKKADEAMTMLGVHFIGAFNVNSNNHFRNQATKFFSDSPNLLKRIEDKEFKLLEIVSLFEEYNKEKANK